MYKYPTYQPVIVKFLYIVYGKPLIPTLRETDTSRPLRLSPLRVHWIRTGLSHEVSKGTCVNSVLL